MDRDTSEFSLKMLMHEASSIFPLTLTHFGIGKEQFKLKIDDIPYRRGLLPRFLGWACSRVVVIFGDPMCQFHSCLKEMSFCIFVFNLRIVFYVSASIDLFCSD